MLVLPLVAASCGLFRRKPTPGPPPPDAVQIGTIDMVNPEGKFVLIHSPARTSPPANSVLEVRSAVGQSAKVQLTPERKGSYLTADIVSGTPAKGEVVIWYRKGLDSVQEAIPSARISLAAPTAPSLEAEAAPLPLPSASPPKTETAP
jgi:hypothetical protein